MAMQTPPAETAEIETGQADPDRLYRISPGVYQGMIEHGLLTARDGVEFRDGLLMEARTDRLYPIPLNVYHGMAEFGLLGKRDKTVLLDGLLVKTMTKGQPHAVATHLTCDALREVIPGDFHVRKEDPLSLAAGPTGRDSEPEPDAYVVRGAIRDYSKRHPVATDLAFVVEVADGSLRDEQKKLARYAWASIPAAWVVNLIDRTVEVYSHPAGPVSPAEYRESLVYREGDEIPVVVDGREVGRVPVRDVLP